MTDFLFSTPVGLCSMIAFVVLVCGGLVFYALRTKGDVSAELTHGETTFKLQARDRAPLRKD
jgi:hypothetical protein